MKQAMIGIVSLTILILAAVAILTIEGRTMKKNELHSAITYSGKEVLGLLQKEKKGAPDNKEELTRLFTENLKKRLYYEEHKKADRDYEITVDMIAADPEKGILSCNVTEEYRHPNGKMGRIREGATAVIEEEVEIPLHRVEYDICVDGRWQIYKVFILEEGSDFPMVDPPKMPQGA
ncbi:MAG: hypothetical protein VZQ50_06470, partial [Lachnospiraceae bacterium]|nr:hypothetical protein [Lachnospiraceae bacterium]